MRTDECVCAHPAVLPEHAVSQFSMTADSFMSRTGVYRSGVPSMPYWLLWEERRLCSVANGVMEF
ncbi:Alcohol dehydrogenase AdhA [Cupriavidus necator]|nr:alcohol dehydrogenase AdhA [Cupriavidus sp. GA3-3]